MCRIAAPIAPIHASFGLRADRRPDCLRQIYSSLARTSVRKSDYDLPGGDHLPGLAECLDDHAVGIGQEDGIVSLVSGNLSICLGCRQLRLGIIERRLGLLIALMRRPPIS